MVFRVDMELLEALLYVIVGVVIYKFLDWMVRIPRLGGNVGRYVFITGCDTGFGRETAIKLDSLGCQVFATCVSEKGEIELKKQCSSRMKTLYLDVSEHASVLKALEFVNKHLPRGKGDNKISINLLILGLIYI